jgi:cytochrome oxidase Cu insertion factor (SCO1/SenC/PrrC family)
MNAIDPRHRGRQRRSLIALALLFFFPLALAFILYYGVGFRPGTRVNHGDLVEPPVPLPDLALPQEADGTRPEVADTAGAAAVTSISPTILKGKWTLLYLGAGSCSPGCRTDLYNTRQVRAALGPDRERVQRVFLAAGACCDFEWLRVQQPDLITVRAGADVEQLTSILERAGRDAATAGAAAGGSGAANPAAADRAAADRVYLVDPLGNLMMSYALDARPKGMLEDLKKLLRLSHVG